MINTKNNTNECMAAAAQHKKEQINHHEPEFAIVLINESSSANQQ
jgi:hypothetical protein